MINIKPANINDAENLCSLFLKLDEETDFMLLEAGERKTSVEQQRVILEQFSSSNTGVFLIAEDEETANIVGSVIGQAGSVNRNKHCITLVIGILRAYSGKGLGKALIERHISWSKAHHFHRIELTVMRHNERAIRLYKSCGFEEEGIKKDSLFVNGKYVDELCMAKILV